MKQKKLMTAIVVVIIVIAFALYSVNSAQKIAGESQSTAGSQKSGWSKGKSAGNGAGGWGKNDGSQAAKVTTVRAYDAAVKTLKPYIDENGDVEANVDVSVYPDIGGRLVDFKVSIGDSVTKGQTIARIDPSKPGSNYSISPVAAPITGTVTSIKVDEGATVTTSTAIASVGIIDDLKIVVNLPERDSAKAAKGMTAVVSFEALPNETFNATITHVSPVLDPTSRSREITLGFAKTDGRISAGMYAKVRLYTTQVTGKLVIPASALIARNDAYSVFVAVDKDGNTVAEKRAVNAGTEVDGYVAITDGINAGDKVIYEGQNGLADGDTVSILTEEAK